MRRADDSSSIKTCKVLSKTVLSEYKMPMLAIELLWNRFCNRTMGAEGSWVECTEDVRTKFKEWLDEEV